MSKLRWHRVSAARYLAQLCDMQSFRAIGAKRITSVLFNMSFPKTLFAMFRLRCRTPRVLVFPKVHCKFHKTAVVDGRGYLLLGKRWDGSAYMPSEFKLMSDSSLTVNGVFVIHTGCSISVNAGGRLVMGSGYASNNITIDCFERIVIGQAVAISKSVTIRDGDSHAINGKNPISGPITIGNHVCGSGGDARRTCQCTRWRRSRQNHKEQCNVGVRMLVLGDAGQPKRPPVNDRISRPSRPGRA